MSKIRHMKKILLTLSIAIIVLSGFVLFKPLTKSVLSSHLNPGEEYALSKQYPAFGEGLNEYKKAVMKELSRMRKSRNIDIPWLNEGPFNTGGRLNCIAVHPTATNTYLVGCADGGIFKTVDDGANWTPIFDTATSLSVSSIVYDLNNPNIVFAGTGDQVLGGYSHMGNGIYKSTDGGTTWINSGLNNVGTITKIIIDPSNSNVLYAGTTGNPFISDNNRGVYKSTDGGATWNNILFLGQNAGIGDIVPSIERPAEYMSVNVQGTVQMLECARAAGVKKFVYAASSSCYGLAAVPTKEDHPITPLYPYALSKYQGEQAAFHWHSVYKLPVNSIRIFNAYGLRSRTSGAGRGVMRSTIAFGLVVFASIQARRAASPSRSTNCNRPLRERSPLWRRLSQFSSVTGPAPAALRARRIAVSAA